MKGEGKQGCHSCSVKWGGCHNGSGMGGGGGGFGGKQSGRS